jgi:hypothetical protein
MVSFGDFIYPEGVSMNRNGQGLASEGVLSYTIDPWITSFRALMGCAPEIFIFAYNKVHHRL